MIAKEKEMFAKVYTGGRKTGKSTMLLERAKSTGFPILTSTTKSKELLNNLALRLGIEGVEIITIKEYEKIDQAMKVIIDEPELLIRHLYKVGVDSFAITSYDVNVMEKEFTAEEGLAFSLPRDEKENPEDDMRTIELKMGYLETLVKTECIFSNSRKGLQENILRVCKSIEEDLKINAKQT